MRPVLPVTLENTWVRIEPLDPSQAGDFVIAGSDPALWRYMFADALSDESTAGRWIDEMLASPAMTASFAVYEKRSGELAGSTSLINANRPFRSVEIGYTWYAKRFQRTLVNTATKRLLLGHVFDELGVVRVQLQTDARNLASQRAIERLGATREGRLRKHKTYPSGDVRDSVIYSIIDDDWPAVRQRLDRLLKDPHEAGVSESSAEKRT